MGKAGGSCSIEMFPLHQRRALSRIEDEVLVTKSGHRVLTDALPRDPGAIERMMRPE